MENKPAPAPKNKFKVVDLKPEIGAAVIELGDGRMATIPIKEGVEVKKHNTVALDKPDFSEDGVPGKGALVGKVVE